MCRGKVFSLISAIPHIYLKPPYNWIFSCVCVCVCVCMFCRNQERRHTLDSVRPMPGGSEKQTIQVDKVCILPLTCSLSAVSVHHETWGGFSFGWGAFCLKTDRK